jgi:hypothetical protein
MKEKEEEKKGNERRQTKEEMEADDSKLKKTRIGIPGLY